MPRPKKLRPQNTYYHLQYFTGAPFFRNDSDRRYFKSILHRWVQRHDLQVFRFSFTESGYEMDLYCGACALRLAILEMNRIYVGNSEHLWRDESVLLRGQLQTRAVTQLPTPGGIYPQGINSPVCRLNVQETGSKGGWRQVS